MSQFYFIHDLSVKQIADADIVNVSNDCNWTDEALVFAEDEEEAKKLCYLWETSALDKDQFYYPDSYGDLIVALRRREE